MTFYCDITNRVLNVAAPLNFQWIEKQMKYFNKVIELFFSTHIHREIDR